MPEVPQWARVRGDLNCHVRRGAWYEVLCLAADEAILEVVNRPFSVPRSSLQIVPLRPHQWSVVARPSDAVMVPLGLALRRLPGLSRSSSAEGTPDRDPVLTVRWRVCRGVG